LNFNTPNHHSICCKEKKKKGKERALCSFLSWNSIRFLCFFFSPRHHFFSIDRCFVLRVLKQRCGPAFFFRLIKEENNQDFRQPGFFVDIKETQE